MIRPALIVAIAIIMVGAMPGYFQRYEFITIDVNDLSGRQAGSLAVRVDKLNGYACTYTSQQVASYVNATWSMRLKEAEVASPLFSMAAPESCF